MSDTPITPSAGAPPGRRPRPKGTVLKPRFLINLDEPTFQAVRRYAFDNGLKQAEVARLALIDYLKRHA
jgi:hypothetical protein